jgi:hypothetical protein
MPYVVNFWKLIHTYADMALAAWLFSFFVAKADQNVRDPSSQNPAFRSSVESIYNAKCLP